MTSRDELLAKLSKEQREELRARLLQRRQSQADRDEFAPLSYGQEALLHLHRLAPHSPGYNTMYVGRVEGEVDEERLAEALRLVCERQDVLRTIYPRDDNGDTRPKVVEASAELSVIDASDWTESELDQRIVEEASRPFRLDRGPVYRARLYRRPQDSRLLIAAHHIAVDFWSYVVLIDDLIACYRDGSGPKLSPLKRTYADFSKRQREASRRGDWERHWDYWKAELAELPSPVKLPTDRSRSAQPSDIGDVVDVDIDARVVQGVADLSKQAGATLYQVFLAAFFVFLWRHSRQDDIVVGTPTSGRSTADSEDVAGYFVNSLPMRARMNSEMTFRQLIAQVRETSLRALEHQDLPFPMLVNRLGGPRGSEGTTLCDVWFSWDRPHRRDRWAGHVLAGSNGSRNPLSLETLSIRQAGAPYDAMLIVFERADSMRASWHYRTELFDRATIQAFARRFLVLLRDLAARPDQELACMELLRPEDRRRLLNDWSGAAAARLIGRGAGPIHETVELHARLRPQHIAIRAGEESLSYRELNRRADAVARTLLRYGVAKEELVGLCVGPTAEMVVGMLGILKAGAAFLPLDPEYPLERIRYMVGDAGVEVALVDDSSKDRLPVQVSKKIAIQDASRCTEPEERAPESGVGPSNLAYVIYTSGSTGTPKGAMLEHGGLTNLAVEQIEMFGVNEESRVLQFSSLSFDASIFQIVMALAAGARLCIAPPAARYPGEDLVDLLEREKVSIVTIPPSVLAALPLRELPDLQVVTVAGEACPADLVSRWAEGRRFFNLYGPTETTIWATANECRPSEEPPSIGRPIANTRAYVLDPHLQLAAPGVPGELHVGGAGVGRGYLNRPELTSEKFLPDPFSHERGGRIYRTGDLVRWRNDGELEFLGRVDDQVKIRGFRIEPGEIQSRLSRIEGVEDCVVLAREVREGEKELWSYVTSRPGARLAEPEIKRKLRAVLPGFMVPDRVVLLDAMPLTANGKIDRRALPDASHDSGTAELAGQAPASGLEERIAAVWREVVGRKDVGRHDNFFDLGGHSLLLARVHALLSSQLEAKVDLVDLFHYPTVASLAARIAGGEVSDSGLHEARDRAGGQRSSRRRRRERAQAIQFNA